MHRWSRSAAVGWGEISQGIKCLHMRSMQSRDNPQLPIAEAKDPTYSGGPARLQSGPRRLKRRRQTPLPLIEMFDALLSPAPGLSAKQKRKRSDEIMATASKCLERKDA